MTSEKPEVSAVENATERSQLARKRKSANDIICGTVFLDVLLAAFANSRGLFEGLKSGLIRHAPGGRGLGGESTTCTGPGIKVCRFC